MNNDGHYYGDLGAGGYSATHRGAPHRIPQRVTPNFEHKEGLRHGPFMPAPYLPGVRLEVLNHDWYVIAAGSPVVLLDDGFAVPAGYKKIIGRAEGPQYTTEDVIARVKRADGQYAVAGQFVAEYMTGNAGIVLGVASYDVFRNLNSDPHNPATYQEHNYNRQNGFSVLTEYVLEFPIEPLKRTAFTKEITVGSDATTLALDHNTVLSHHVALTVNRDRVEAFTFVQGEPCSLSGLDLKTGDKLVVSYLFEETVYSAPFAGMTTFRGEVKASAQVTYDADSKFVVFTPSTVDVADATTVVTAIEEREEILGHITAVDYKFPKQMLDKVTTAYDDRLYSPIINPQTGAAEFQSLDKMPGSANDGVPHMIQYAGGDLNTGIVRFHLHL